MKALGKRRALGLVLLLLAGAALAQPAVTRGGALKKRAYQTYADATYYVDPTGSDSSACTSSGTGACATLGGVLAKVPARIRHVVTINIAAGTYALSSALNFPSFQFSDAGQLVVQGTTWSNWTPATGNATGTVTTYTAGSSATVTLGSITDSGQSWTADDLKGSYLTITSGASSGTSRVIVGNTATSLNFTGTISGVSAGTTYAIQRPAAVLTGTGTSAGLVNLSGLTGGTSTSSAVILSDFAVEASGAGGGLYAMRINGCSVADSLGFHGQTVTLRRLRVVGPAGLAVSAGSDVAFSTNTTYTEARVGSGLFFSESVLRDAGGYTRSLTGPALTVPVGFISTPGLAQWGVYEGTYAISASGTSTNLYTGGLTISLYTATLRGTTSCVALAQGILSASAISCASSSNDFSLSRSATATVSSYMGWSGQPNALTIDGETFTSAAVEALSPRQVFGVQGSKFYRY